MLGVFSYGGISPLQFSTRMLASTHRPMFSATPMVGIDYSIMAVQSNFLCILRKFMDNLSVNIAISGYKLAKLCN